MKVLGIIIILLIIYILFLIYKTYKYEKSLNMFFYNFFKYTLKPIFKFYYPYKVVNKELLNINGPVIFAGNHIHLMDQCLLILLTDRPVHFMAKIEYFQNKKTKWFFKLSGCIPVDRKIKDENAKNAAIEVLENNNALGIFPEGTRNKTDKLLQEFKFGAVSMAKKTDSTIVPFSITGNYKFRSKDLKIEIGTPFKVGDSTLEDANNKLYNIILDNIKKNSNK